MGLFSVFSKNKQSAEKKAEFTIPANLRDCLQVKSSMPGKVYAILTNVGQQVEEGDLLMVIEVMKMEIPIEAKEPGVVKLIAVNKGDNVDSDDILVLIDTYHNRSSKDALKISQCIDAMKVDGYEFSNIKQYSILEISRMLKNMNTLQAQYFAMYSYHKRPEEVTLSFLSTLSNTQIRCVENIILAVIEYDFVTAMSYIHEFLENDSDTNRIISINEYYVLRYLIGICFHSLRLAEFKK